MNHKNRRLHWVGIAAVTSLYGSAFAQSLEEAVKLTLYNEPEIQAANFDRLSAIEDWKIVKADLMPQVTIDGSAGYLQRDRTTDGLIQSSGDGLLSRQIGVSVRQLIFDGGLARHQAISAKHGYEVQELVERSMLEARVVDLCEVYVEVLRAREQVREAQEQVNRQKEMRDMIKEKVGAGGNRADLALVDGRLSLAANSVESQQLALENALIRFVRLTGQPASGLTYPPVPLLPAAQSELNLESNWDYLASTAALEAATAKHRSVKGNRGPKVYFDAGASKGRDVLGIEGQDDEVSAMVVMSWDIFRGGANKALVQREHWQVRKAEELVRASIEQSEYLSSLLWKEREGSKASVRSLGSYVDRLEGVLSDYNEQFKVGRQDLLNILDIQSELYTAKTKLIDAKYNIDTSAYRIVGVQGTLTDLLVGEETIQEYLDRDPDEDPAPENLLSVRGLPEPGATETENPTPVSYVSEPGEPVATPAPSEVSSDPPTKTRRFKLNPFSSSEGNR